MALVSCRILVRGGSRYRVRVSMLLAKTETFVGIGWHLDVIEVDADVLSMGPIRAG